MGYQFILKSSGTKSRKSKPRDATIREKFDTYKFADYKEQVIGLLDRVTTESVRTMAVIGEMVG
jgi:hypothetical protein